MLPDMHSMFPLQGNNAFSVLSAPNSSLPENHPGANGKRYFTIQRVNGTGAQGQGQGCGHQHTLEDSDRVKKNSVQRILLKEDKERKKMMVCLPLLLFVPGCTACMYGQAGVGLASPRRTCCYVTVKIDCHPRVTQSPSLRSSYCGTAFSEIPFNKEKQNREPL